MSTSLGPDGSAKGGRPECPGLGRCGRRAAEGSDEQ